MAAPRSCIICLESCTSKRFKIVEDPVGQNAVNGELDVFFVLKRVLDVPSHLLEELIKKYGSPSEWGVFVCDECRETYIQRAKELNERSMEIGRQFKVMKDQVKEHVNRAKMMSEDPNNPGGEVKGKGRGRGRGKRGKGNNPTEVFNQVRKWVVDNSDPKIKDNIQVLIEASGGIDNYLAQLRVEKSFKKLGPGRTLTSGHHDQPKAGPSSAISNGTGQNKCGSASTSATFASPPKESPELKPQSPLFNVRSPGPDKQKVEETAATEAAKIASEQKRAAAAAALKRFEMNKKPDADSKELLQARQAAYVKEQARKELEQEKGDNEQEKKDDKLQNDSPPKKVIDPASYAVKGVFYTCPSIGCNTPLPKLEVEDKIREYLIKELKNENSELSEAKVACQIIQSCNKPRDKVTVCVDTVNKYLDNLIRNPTEQKFRQIRISNKVYQERVGCVFGSEHFLKACGFEKTMLPNMDTWNEEEEEYWYFEPDDETTFIADLIEQRDTLKSTTPILPQLDRNVQVLHPQQASKRSEFPDEFYIVNKDEVKREQERKTEIAERELTLRTKAMREKEGINEYRIYRYAIIRVRFPDNKILQGTFGAYEKASTIKEFVRRNLISSDLEEFDLVQPTGETLSANNKDATLLDLKLVPTAILNFRMENIPPAIASGELSFLDSSLLVDMGD